MCSLAYQYSGSYQEQQYWSDTYSTQSNNLSIGSSTPNSFDTTDAVPFLPMMCADTASDDHFLDKLPAKVSSKGSSEITFLMSTLIEAEANEKILRGWDAFKVFPCHARLGLVEYPGFNPPGVLELIVMAIWDSPEKRLSLGDICNAIEARFPLDTKKGEKSRRSTIRHTLSLKKCFRKMERPESMTGRGGFWTVDPSEGKINCSNRRGAVKSKLGPRTRNKKSSNKAQQISEVVSDKKPANEHELSTLVGLPVFEWDYQGVMVLH